MWDAIVLNVVVPYLALALFATGAGLLLEGPRGAFKVGYFFVAKIPTKIVGLLVWALGGIIQQLFRR